MNRKELIEKINHNGLFLRYPFWIREDTKMSDEQLTKLYMKSEEKMKEYVLKPVSRYSYEPIKGWQYYNELTNRELEKEINKSWQ